MSAMLLPILGLIVVAFVISAPLTWGLMRVGRRLGAIDSAGSAGHEKTLRHVPNIGGVAIFIAIAVPMISGLIALKVVDPETWRDTLPTVAEHLTRLVSGTEETRSSFVVAIALLLSLTALHIVGLVDDRRSLGPMPKLAVQCAAAAVMTIWFDVRLFELLGDVPSIIVTILWILAITNAINFLDNMDGLAGGVGVIASSLFMAACIINGQWFIAATLALLIGALLGFLLFNFPPAKIFMGDGGSLIIGFLLAVLTARTTFLHQDLGGGWYGVFMPLIVLAVPLYDLMSVTLIRLKQGTSPFVGDQRHFSHRLVERGLSPRGAVIMIWCFTAVTGIGGIALGRLDAWQAILVAVQTLLVLVTLALLEHTSRHAVRHRKHATSGRTGNG